MSTLIVVCGPGGAGKTTLADALSRETRLVCLHKDSIKAVLHDRLGILTSRSYQVFCLLIEEQLADGVDLIIEATFHGDDAPALLRRWCHDFDVDLLCVVCEAEVGLRRRRIESRHRHASHADADARQLQSLDDVADYSALPGTILHLDTDRPVEHCVREVLGALGETTGWHGERAPSPPAADG